MSRLSITLSTRTPISAMTAEVLRLQLSSSVAFANVEQVLLSENKAVFSGVDALPAGGASSRMYQHDAAWHAAQMARADVNRVSIERAV